MEKKRPMVITFLAVVLFINALLSAGTALIWAGGLGIALAGGLPGVNIPILAKMILILLLSIAGFVVAFGLWGLQPWAWLVAVIITGAKLLVGLIGLLTGDQVYIFWWIVDLAIFVYLMTPKIRDAFKPEAS